MPANIDPIYTKTPNVTSVAVTAANTSSQGGGTIGTDIFLCFTAGTNGSFVRELRALATSSVAATATTATVLRIFTSSQASGATTNANTHLQFEVALGSQTADQTTIATFPIIIPLNFVLNAGQTILITHHSAPAASTQWKHTVIGGDY